MPDMRLARVRDYRRRTQHYFPTRAGVPWARTARPPGDAIHTVSTTDSRQLETKPLVPSVEDIFGDSAPWRSAKDLPHAGIFDDDEVEEFIADLYAMRRSDVA